MDLPRIYFSAWCLGLLALAMPTLSAADDGMVWCEGEAATSSTMAPHNWCSDMVDDVAASPSHHTMPSSVADNVGMANASKPKHQVLK